MNENSFDFLSDNEISEMLTPFPPPDNVTKTVSPWRKATRQMLVGFALMAVVPQIFPLNLIFPVAGPILALLGFRSLRKENKWFFLGYILSSIALGFEAVSLFLNSSIIRYTTESSAPFTVMAMTSLLLIFMIAVSISAGFITVKKKLQYSSSDFSSYALIGIMALIIFLALINFTGVFAFLVLIAYILVFIFLIKLSKELDEYGYSIEIASVQNSDKTVATICLGLAFLISLTGYVFFSRYPMEWKPQVKTESAQIEEIKTNLLSLGFPEHVLNDLKDEDILDCENAVYVGADVQMEAFNNGRRVTETRGNVHYTHTEYDEKEMQFTIVYALINEKENEWKIFHHFNWVIDKGHFATEAFTVDPPEVGDTYLVEDISGRVLYDENGTTFVSPFFKEGNQVYTSGSILNYGHTLNTYFAEFSYPLKGENKRGYATYSIRTTDSKLCENSFLNYAHNTSPLQYPVDSGATALQKWLRKSLAYKIRQHVVLLDFDERFK